MREESGSSSRRGFSKVWTSPVTKTPPTRPARALGRDTETRTGARTRTGDASRCHGIGPCPVLPEVEQWARTRREAGSTSRGSMRFFILGANGRTGSELIDLSLARGHQLTAFVRSPEKITRQDGRLRVVKGDPHDPEAMARAMKGHDAVLSALGPK